MEKFRTKYNYPAFIFFISIFFILAGGLIYFIFRMIDLVPQQSTTNSLKLFSGGLLILGYLLFLFGHLILLVRFSLLIIDNNFFTEDNLLLQQNNITDNITGYSKTQIEQRRYSMDTLILYLKNGNKINLSKLMIRNFSELEQQLINNKVPFLGYETFQGKSILKRKYKFD